MSEKTTEEKVNELIQQSSDESTLITNLKNNFVIQTETDSDLLSLIEQELLITLKIIRIHTPLNPIE